ncbi:MAG: zinc ribbon domain-containing protein [Actinomycetota bacterium]
MATQEDVDRIASMAQRTQDVAQLRQHRQELLDIAASMAQVVAKTSDSGLQQQAAEIRDSAESAAEEILGRARQLELDQMDPDYERRKAEREQFAQQEQQRQAQEAQEGMKQLQGLFGGGGGGGGGAAGAGGLGGLLGGLFGGRGAQPEQQAAEPGPAPAAETPPVPAPQPPPSPTPQPPPIPAPQPGGDGATASCKNCHAQVKAGAKFCPECGTANPTVNACASCGQALEGSPKFCPNCGAPTAA